MSTPVRPGAEAINSLIREQAVNDLKEAHKGWCEHATSYIVAYMEWYLERPDGAAPVAPRALHPFMAKVVRECVADAAAWAVVARRRKP